MRGGHQTIPPRTNPSNISTPPLERRTTLFIADDPGVPVAKLALADGINATLLHTWIGKQQRQSLAAISSRGSVATPSPFIPVVSINAQRSPITALQAMCFRVVVSAAPSFSSSREYSCANSLTLTSILLARTSTPLSP